MATTPLEKPLPPSATESVAQQFRRHESRWSEETIYLSDPSKIMGHPSMRAIVSLGEDVVPLILNDLQARESLLVWALPEITGENLLQPKVEGGFVKSDVKGQVEAWLRWGRGKGLV